MVLGNLSHTNPCKSVSITHPIENVEVIQTEINGKYTDCNNIKKLKNIFNHYKNFVEQYNDYINR